MDSITIDLPHPPAALKPNSRPHWRAKARATRAYRNATLATALSVSRIGSKWPSASVRIIATYRDSRRRDRDNILASLKAAFDGLADAGIVADDADFTYEPVEIRKGKDVGIRLVITKAKGATSGEA